MPPEHRAGLFPALLKHWRGRRGLSQLDLALTADVSSRHISFLETGRSSPSADMVLRLSSTLDVPLRHVNAMLRAAGHAPAYPEPRPGEALPEGVAEAVRLIKAHHEPFPVVIINRTYDLLDANQGAMALFAAMVDDPSTLASGSPNIARLTFDPRGARKALANFDEVASTLLWRMQREVLEDPDDGPLQALLAELLDSDAVDPRWREVDLAVPSQPTLVVHVRRGDLDLRFLTTVTVFQAPQNVQVAELKMEAWYPEDAATAEACRRLVEAAGGR